MISHHSSSSSAWCRGPQKWRSTLANRGHHYCSANCDIHYLVCVIQGSQLIQSLGQASDLGVIMPGGRMMISMQEAEWDDMHAGYRTQDAVPVIHIRFVVKHLLEALNVIWLMAMVYKRLSRDRWYDP